MVIGLYKQRPELDHYVHKSFEDNIIDYGRKLGIVNKGLASWTLNDNQHIKLYNPVNAFLWGTYDRVTFFMADDLESVPAISFYNSIGSQELLFGSPFCNGEAPTEGLNSLFNPEFISKEPLVAISRVKIADQWKAIYGAQLSHHIHQYIIKKSKSFNIRSIILRGWSWPDLIVISFSSCPKTLFQLTDIIANLNFRNLIRQSSVDFKAFFDKALEEKVPRSIINNWVMGRRATKQNKAKKSKVRSKLTRCDIFVSIDTHFGMLEEGWKSGATKFLSKNSINFLKQQSEIDLKNYKKNNTKHKSISQNYLIKDFEKFSKYLSKKYSTPELKTTITLKVKPGHLHVAIIEAKKLLSKIVIPNSIHKGLANKSPTVLLELSLPNQKDGLFFLLGICYMLRIYSGLRHHVLDIETHVFEHAITKISPSFRKNPDPTGYQLLPDITDPDLTRFEHYQIARKGLGRAQALACLAWYRAILQAAGRPEIFGTTMDLYSAAKAIYRELTYGKDERDFGYLANAATRLGTYVQRGFQQRLQFSPVLAGAPPINGQLPFGVNQLVSMLDGLILVIMQAAFINDQKLKENDENNPDLSFRKFIVVFEAEEAIFLKSFLHFQVLNLNLIQAINPLSLCMLFHELGHVIFKYWIWCNLAERKSHHFYYQKESFFQNKVLIPAAEIAAKAGSWDKQIDWRNRIANFFEDIFAHSVWRRLGCRNNFEIFECQFLSGQAMGFRVYGNRHDPQVALQVWAETIMHLYFQYQLYRYDDHLEKTVSKILSNKKRLEDLDNFIDRAFRYAEGELGFARIKFNLNQKEGKKLKPNEMRGVVRAFVTRYIKSLVPLFFDYLLNRNETNVFRFFEPLMDRITRINRLIEEKHGQNEITLDKLAKSIQRGNVVAKIDWTMVSAEGCPTIQSFLWVREILKGITIHFLENQKVQGKLKPHYSIQRDNNFRIDFKKIEAGLYCDMAGGLFAAGTTLRSDYLRVRLAGIQSLSEISLRSLGGSLRTRFMRERLFFRHPENREISYKRVSSNRRNPAKIFDFSPKGVKLKLDSCKAFNELKVGDNLEIASKHKKSFLFTIRWKNKKNLTLGCQLIEVEGGNSYPMLPDLSWPEQCL